MCVWWMMVTLGSHQQKHWVVSSDVENSGDEWMVSNRCTNIRNRGDKWIVNNRCDNMDMVR